jgi:hypothetical protein
VRALARSERLRRELASAIISALLAPQGFDT